MTAAESWNRQTCQTALTNCPQNTTIISPTDPRAHFRTLQSAITSLPNDTSTQTLLLLAGTYTEQVNITRRGPITILGQTDPKDITNPVRNKVTVTFASANTDSTGQMSDNVFTSVLVVAPTLESSLTGSGPTGYPVPKETGFGNVDFRVYNVDFVNAAAEYSAGPAHAISFSRGNGGFYFCGFYSYQDTVCLRSPFHLSRDGKLMKQVYIGKLANAYFYNSILAGETDFLYGFGTAYVQSSSVHLRNCGGGITAWKGANTTKPNKFGIYIVDSTIRAANSSVAADIKRKCALGRPWNSLHRSIFARSFEDGSIRPAGYSDWVVDGVSRVTNDTLMAEFRDFGPGFDRERRVKGGLDVILGVEGWEEYNGPEKVFRSPDGDFGDVTWIDWGVVGERW